MTKEEVQERIVLLYSLSELGDRKLRRGQVIFNLATLIFPDSTEQLRGSAADCFYIDAKIVDFIKTLSLIESKKAKSIKYLQREAFNAGRTNYRGEVNIEEDVNGDYFPAFIPEFKTFNKYLKSLKDE